jgi:hypothetical protein
MNWPVLALACTAAMVWSGCVVQIARMLIGF